MTSETEKKIKIPNQETFEKVLMCCRRLFGEGEQINQTDEYFDNIDETLKKEDFTVRLRLTNGSSKFALKSPRITLENGSYTRIDLEFSVNEDDIRQELSRKNLIATALIEKIRWKFKVDGIKVTVDKYPFVGYYLEVEAQNENIIEEVLNKLDLSNETPIQKNSTELIEEKLFELNLPLRPNLRVTFEFEKKFKNL